MAGPAGLSLWRWLVPVVLLHLVALEWLSRESETLAALQPMGEVMYTRMLEPAAPPPLTAVPVAVQPAVPQGVFAVAPPRPAASAPRQQETPRAAAKEAPPRLEEHEPPAAPPPAASGPAVAELPPADALAGVELAAEAGAGAGAAASTPAPAPATEPAPAAAAASAPAAGAPAPAETTSPVDTWPTDTRLNYRLGGQFRSGQIYGDARVLWQRDGTRYQVQVDLDVTLFARMIITSQGEVTPDGLQPQAYEEVRPGRKRRGAAFGREQVVLDNGSLAPRPAGMQDAASQFVDLAHRFATGRETLAVGRTVDLWLGRPGGVDLWTYDVIGLETLQTPGFGAVQAWRLKPRPLSKPRGKVTAEMWFAPSLQYLPVRIRLWTGDDAVIDLMVERIEQR